MSPASSDVGSRFNSNSCNVGRSGVKASEDVGTFTNGDEKGLTVGCNKSFSLL